MADDADRASIDIGSHLSRVLDDHREMMVHLHGKPSLAHCAECGDEIPQGRREALPGCTHCIECAQEIYMRGKI